jgi:hypothetical protein
VHNHLRTHGSEGATEPGRDGSGPVGTGRPVLTVKIRQPSHEFTFGVGIKFYTLSIGTNPRGITSSRVHVGFGV